MTIMFLIRSLGPGGAERQLTNLAKGLQQSGHHVVVVTFYSGRWLEDELTDSGVTVRSLNKRGRWDIANAAWRFLRLVREVRPTILHSYLSTANLLSLLSKLFHPSLRVVWGVRASNVDFLVYDWFTKFSFSCECLLSNAADLIISNSIVGRDYHVAQGFPARKLIAIHNGIDIDCFKRDEQAGAAVRQELGLEDDDIVIGHVARLDPMKDHPTFLRAVALLVKKRANIRIVCVGEGPKRYREELRSLAKALGLANRIIWAGSRRDMAAVYSACNVTVCSSAWGEGFPNVVAEAMACGVPCVATDVGDSGVILENLKGQLVPPGDPEALAASVANLLDSDTTCNDLRKYITERFGHIRMLRQTETTLLDLICH
jgi:glycosyltransferase involved in cell wall biosynthesis